MKIIFLGTNGWYDTNTGNTPCILIQTEEYNIILDAGNGIYKIDQYIKDNKPIYLLLSHFHLDHIFGLHILPKFKFEQGIKIFGQKGVIKVLNTFINHPYSMPIKDQPTKINIHELPNEKELLPFGIDCLKMFHADPVLGYRLNINNKIISYSGDAGIEENSKKLAENSDLLIHECTLIKNNISSWGHTNPYQVATLAKENNVKKLTLVHFDATTYKTIDMRKEAEEIAQSIFPNTIAAMDDMVIEI